MEYRLNGEAVVASTVVRMREFMDDKVRCEWVDPKTLEPREEWYSKDLVRPLPTPEEQEAHRRRESTYHPYGANNWKTM